MIFCPFASLRLAGSGPEPRDGRQAPGVLQHNVVLEIERRSISKTRKIATVFLREFWVYTFHKFIGMGLVR
jgi:hypothetical protein